MFTSVPSKSAGGSFTGSEYEAYWRANMNSGVMRPLGGVLLDADVATVTLSNLSAQDFWALLVFVEARSNAAVTSTNWRMRINGDASANHGYNRGWGRNVTATFDVGSTETGILGLNIPGGSSPAGVFGFTVLQIMGAQTSGQYRVTSGLAVSKGSNASSGMYTGFIGGMWPNTTDPLSTLTFIPQLGSFATGSRFMVYGIGDIA